MDGQGHVALTDFGLSKQHVQSNDAASTFCGTAEYIAPELLRGKRYGAAVDWWSFGILLYEMQAGRTPFYDKNRKIMSVPFLDALSFHLFQFFKAPLFFMCGLTLCLFFCYVPIIAP